MRRGNRAGSGMERCRSSLPIPPPFLYPSDRREPGPAGVSDGVVALGGMEWRECDGTVRDKPQG